MPRILSALVIALVICPTLHSQLTVGLQRANQVAPRGYTLMAPINSKSTYLLDFCGRAVHEWRSDYTPGFSAELVRDADLLRMTRLGTSPVLEGAGGGVELRSWDNDLLWSYSISDTNTIMHHDCTMLPNGNILVLVAERYTKEQAWARGRDTTVLQGDFWVDAVYELQPNGDSGGDIVWKWCLWDHLVQERYPELEGYGSVNKNYGRVDINYTDPTQGKNYSDFSHCNSVDYNATTDQILISARNFHEVWIIDHSTTTQEAATETGGKNNRGGMILYRWGNPMAYGAGTMEQRRLFGQHNAHWIQAGLPYAGHIMVFNNGLSRPGGQYATVDAFLPVGSDNGEYMLNQQGRFGPDSAVFSFDGGSPGTLQSMFMSGADFIADGSLRITEGMRGIVSENDLSNVTWQYICPINAAGPIKQGDNPSANGLFNSYWYASSNPMFASHDLSAGTPIELDPVDIGCTTTSAVDEPVEGTFHTWMTFAPNPCESGGIVSGLNNDDWLRLVNTLGETLQIITAAGNNHPVDLTGYQPGVYWLQSKDNKTISIIKR